VVRTGAAHRDRADDHQLVEEVFGVGEPLGIDGGRGLFYGAVEHLIGTSWPRRTVFWSVVWSMAVSMTMLSSALHLDFDLVEQFSKLMAR
jgi:hypothetical protein